MRALLVPFLLISTITIAACRQDAEPDAEASVSGLRERVAGTACVTNADCPNGAKYCAANEAGALVCQAKVDTGGGACGARRAGANEPGIGRACAAGSCADRASANVCVEAPALATAFCSRACSSDLDCGYSAFCGKTGAAGADVCIPFECACAAVTETSQLLSQALQTAGKSACDLGQRFGSLRGVYGDEIANDAVRPTIYQRLYHSPMAIPHAGRELADEARAARSGAFVSGVVRTAARLWDEELPRGHLPAAAPATFDDAVLAFHAVTGSARDTLAAQVAADAADLPPALRRELAPILVAMRTAVDLRNQAIPAGADLNRWFRAPMGMFQQMNEVISRADKIDLSRPADRAFMLEGFRYDLLARAAVIVSEAVEGSALRTQSFAGTYAFNQSTPWGRIVVRGTGDDQYLASDPSLSGDLLLVVDTGGKDRYEIPVGGTQGPSNPVSVAIDLGGADTYTYAKFPGPGDANERPVSDAAGRRPSVPRRSLSEVHRQGSASLGVAMLFDFGRDDDVYESLRFSQGSGVLGVGVLYDEAGNDRYDAETIAQGAAHFGLGILIDGAGNDRYHGYAVMQGAAQVKGVGLLVDYEGDDTYWAGPGTAYIAPDQRTPGDDYLYEYGINQGAAWGRRGDYPQDGIRNDAHLSGGIGALLDLDGADSYTCGAFCQGTGYWFGTGILWDDGAGKDKSFGRVFAAGTGVHFGLGIYHDGGGDDQHHVDAPCVGQTLGSGDDLSLGWFEDLGGNDRYEGCGNSLGSGTEKGTGVFVDLSGNDDYRSTRAGALGWAQDPAPWHATTHGRYALRTMGVFADGAGNDAYTRPQHFEPDPVGSGRSWSHPWAKESPAAGARVPLAQPAVYPSPNVCGVGLDR